MLLSEEEYCHAVDLLEGQTEKEPLLQEFEEWFQDAFGLRVYDYICDTANTGRLRLKVVLWDRDCRKKMMRGINPDFRKQKKTAEKFSGLCRKYGLHEAYGRAGDILVCYDTLQDELGKRILEQAADRIKALEGRQDIRRVEILFHTVHIFFETEEQKERHLRDGVCEAADRQVSSIIKEYDRFGAYPEGFRCIFSSLQILNEKYKGNMFYYTR